MKTFFIIFFIVAAIVQFGCNQLSTGPEAVKDPRAYIWTVDTLAYPGSFQTFMRDIWGSSPKDVYVVGHNDRGFGKMFHYDGKGWKPVDLAFGAIDLSAIYGFGANDIWAVGERIYSNPNPPPNFLDSSLVIHFDGMKWQELKLNRGRVLSSVWGNSSRDLWFGGINGTLFHYGGVVAMRDSVPLPIPREADPFYNFYSITGRSASEAYMLLYAPPFKTGGDRYYVFSRQANAWTVMDSILYSRRTAVWMSPSGTLYAIGDGVYKRVGTTWQTMQLDALRSIGIFGIGDDNLFVVGRSGAALFGEVYHYNGRDWFQVESARLPKTPYYGVWTDGREAFVVGVTNDFPQKTIILHGK